MPRLSEYDYELPPELIAQEPLEERTASRLLLLNKSSGAVEDRKFTDLAQLLRPGDLLVLNNTRVSALRLFGKKATGAQVEALLLQEISPRRFVALVKPAKRLDVGVRVDFGGGLIAEVDELGEEGKRVLQFDDVAEFALRLQEAGEVPLPPDIHFTAIDPERYQTVVAKHGGSAAAPTAALHFSMPFLENLKALGVTIAEVTLDVGIDTFRPVQADDLAEHVMHGERCSVSPETASAIAACGGRVIAVGTTTVRTLESFAAGPRTVESGEKSTRLFIQPGYQFRAVDGILTNFHMPKTTMLIMISAMCSRNHLLSAYHHAVSERYRFLSFGDSMLVV